MAPTKTYDVNDRYYVIVGYSTARAIPDDPSIHVGFYLYPTSHNKSEQYYSSLSTAQIPGFKYTRAPTTDHDEAGNKFTPIAGIPDIPGDGIWIAYYTPTERSPNDHSERKKKLMETEMSRIIQEFASIQAESVGGVERKRNTEKGVILKRGDGLNVWFGVLEMEVKYSDYRPGSGNKQNGTAGGGSGVLEPGDEKGAL